MVKVAAVALALMLSPARGLAKPAKPLWTHRPASGYIDDALAFSDDGRHLAFIHTDAATFLKVVVLDTTTFRTLKRIAVRGATKIPRQLVFNANASRIILVWIDSSTSRQGAMLFDTRSGKLLKKVGGATRARVIRYGNQLTLALAREKTGRRGARRVSVTLHRARDLRRLKGGAVKIRPDLTLRKPPLRVMYWEPGMALLLGMEKGKYDRKRDIRLPDVAVRYDIVRKRQIWRHQPRDLLAWNRAINMRTSHPEQRRFLHVSNDRKRLFLVGANNTVKQVRTPIPWRLYEPRSLKQHERWDGTRLHFSMTIDPVNPDAVKRKKADKARMDLYRVGPGAAIKMLGQVLTGKRRFTWAVGKHRFAYLRKLKGFGRGGNLLALYRARK